MTYGPLGRILKAGDAFRSLATSRATGADRARAKRCNATSPEGSPTILREADPCFAAPLSPLPPENTGVNRHQAAAICVGGATSCATHRGSPS